MSYGQRKLEGLHRQFRTFNSEIQPIFAVWFCQQSGIFVRPRQRHYGFNRVSCANSCDHQSVRLFVAGLAPRVDEDDDDDEDEEEDEEEDRVPLMALINPEIAVLGDDTADDWEGCLSIPDIRGRVTRPREIKVKAYDRRGRRIEINARGFTARVIQHETDHLDGVLFFDRMESLETLTFLEEFSKFWSSRNRNLQEG